jgi:hypothetical protein
VFYRHAAVQSRTYLFTYIVLLYGALPKMEKTESSSKASPFYRSASRLFCSCRLSTTPWLEAREGHAKTEDNSRFPDLADTDLQYDTVTTRILTIFLLMVKS